ncbi:MAG: energy transducer TonB [Treponema sp.]|jgi:TonB family protein|nr:energy transducer TonB [Treponema sp.]
MWQYAMMSGADAGYADRRRNLLPRLGCFALLVAFHAIGLWVGDFSYEPAPVPETRTLSFTFDSASLGVFTEPDAPRELLEEPVREPVLAAAAVHEPAATLPIPEPVIPQAELPASELPPAILTQPAETGEPAALGAAVEPVPQTGELGLSGTEDTAAVLPSGTIGQPESTGITQGDAPVPVSTGSGRQGSAMTDAEYLALIMRRLEEKKVYPLSVRKRGIEGDITVDFVIRPDGTVSGLTLADPSGHRFLAQAAFETVRSASPLPVMEDRKTDYTVRIAIRYRLNP